MFLVLPKKLGNHQTECYGKNIHELNYVVTRFFNIPYRLAPSKHIRTTKYFEIREGGDEIVRGYQLCD